MAVPWLAVGKLVLANLDTIVDVVKPAFTRKTIDALPSQADLLNQQIVELQSAASSNADQIQKLAGQLREIVTALEQAATSAAAERVTNRRLSYAAIAIATAALVVIIVSTVLR